MLYECVQCNAQEVVKASDTKMDGSSCKKCGSPILPLGCAWVDLTSDGGSAGVKRKDGLTIKEGRAMDALATAWNEFARLDMTHPSDMPEFTNGIHKCQQILGMRVLQRDYPEGYPTKK